MTADDPAWVDHALDRFARSGPGLPLAVAFSGGADSTALLLACAQRWPGQVQAWHVNHGLQQAAVQFEAFCQQLCKRLGIPLLLRRVDARAAPGQSPEDAARVHRYAALDALALGATVRPGTVLLAQHADDQVETILLALSRGAGLPGLAAMPARWQRGEQAYCRPLLEVPEPAIRAWLRRQGQDWVEDPSNGDRIFLRNRIRLDLLPVLETMFPRFRRTFARSARHAAQAQELLQQLAVADLSRCGLPPRIDALQSLPPQRQGNLLRHWLHSQYGQLPSSVQLRELLRQVDACRTRGHRIELKVGGGQVRRAGAHLQWLPGKRPVD